MREAPKKEGFSLTEVLMAVGILAIGVMMIAGVFPVGIHLTTVAVERTIGAVAADEAFAKIELYAKGDPNVPSDDIDLTILYLDTMTDFNGAFPPGVSIDPNEFAYPSINDPNVKPMYYWSALCRLTGDGLVQVTVFVSRKRGAGLRYYGGTGDWPVPVDVNVTGVGGEDNKLEFTEEEYEKYINDGSTIVDNETGQIYRVLERIVRDPPGKDRIKLDRNWDYDATAVPNKIWVVPPPIGASKYPCIGIYQKVMRL